jgi:hypothetical protein
VIQAALAKSANLDFRAVLDPRPARQTAGFGGLVFALAAALALISPTLISIGTRRLLIPWQNLSWPKRHALTIEGAASRIAYGSTFQAVVADRRGRLPSDLRIETRSVDGPQRQVESASIAARGHKSRFEIKTLTHDLEYRAVGGDDDTMPWSRLTVVQPPVIDNLKVLVEPPAYSGLDTRTEDSIADLLAGSTFTIQGIASRPVRSLKLHAESSVAPAATAEISADGRSFQFSPEQLGPIDQPQAFEIDVTDKEGLSFSAVAHIQLHCANDSPPSIDWTMPLDDLSVTPSATLPITATVQDDLAVRSVELRYVEPGDSESENRLVLFRANDNSTKQSKQPGDSNAADWPPPGQLLQLNQPLDLSRFSGLSSGDTLLLRLIAEDVKGQQIQTAPRRIRIISDQQFEMRAQSQMEEIARQLSAALQAAERGHEHLSRAKPRTTDSDARSSGLLQLLQQASQAARQVERLLGPTAGGSEARIRELLAELDMNRNTGEQLRQQLAELLPPIVELNRGLQPELDRQLATLSAAADQLADRPTSELDSLFESALKTQGAVVEAIRRLTDGASASARQEQLRQATNSIYEEQKRIAAETDALALARLAGATNFVAADRATGAELADRQLALAQWMDQLQQKFAAASASGRNSIAKPLNDKAHASASSKIGSHMREAVSSLRQSQPGLARQPQQQAIQELKALRGLMGDPVTGDAPSNQPPADQDAATPTGRGVSREELLKLRSGQQTLNERARNLASQIDPVAGPDARQTKALQALAEEQRRLADEILRLEEP